MQHTHSYEELDYIVDVLYAFHDCKNRNDIKFEQLFGDLSNWGVIL